MATTYNVGVVLTYSNTDFWSAYDAYQSQFAKSLGVHLITTTPTNGNISGQNSAIESLITVDHVKAIIVNPESAESLGGAVGAFIAAHHANIISVDTTLSAGHAYAVVRASNLIYGEDACALMSSKFTSGDVADLEGDLTSSNGADRTNSFNACMAVNDPGVHILKDPTVWGDHDGRLRRPHCLHLVQQQAEGRLQPMEQPGDRDRRHLRRGHRVPSQLQHGALRTSRSSLTTASRSKCATSSTAPSTRSQSQPANLYAEWSLKFAIDALQGVKLHAGEMFGGLALVSQTYSGDTNLGYPIVAPFITKTAMTLHVKNYTVSGQTLGGTIQTTPVTNHSTWGWSYTAAHGGNPCTVS